MEESSHNHGTTISDNLEEFTTYYIIKKKLNIDLNCQNNNNINT